LYPLDTLKTRLQSSQGFIKSGGFRGVYNGLNVAMTGKGSFIKVLLQSCHVLTNFDLFFLHTTLSKKKSNFQ
jgi:hypothetical protein